MVWRDRYIPILEFPCKMSFKNYIILSLLFTSCSIFEQKPVKSIIKNFENENGPVMVVAHRANISDTLPENSLESIALCIEKGIDILEIDVRVTKDGVLIVMHDETLNRMTNGRGKIIDINWSEIENLKLREKSYGQITDYSIPTLEEVFALCKGKVMLNLDKGFWYLHKIQVLAAENNVSRQIILKSYDEKEKVESQLNDSLYFNFMPIIAENHVANLQNLDAWLSPDNSYPPEAFELIFDEPNDSIGQTGFINSLKDSGARVWINTLSDRLSGGRGEKNDPTKSWNEVINLGFNIIQTDRSLELKQYLDSLPTNN